MSKPLKRFLVSRPQQLLLKCKNFVPKLFASKRRKRLLLPVLRERLMNWNIGIEMRNASLDGPEESSALTSLGFAPTGQMAGIANLAITKWPSNMCNMYGWNTTD